MSDRPSSSPPSRHAPGYAVFVVRSTYRQRRLIDAAGFLPILGALLFALPLLWLGQGGGAARTSHVMIYIFAAWAGLTILSALIARNLRAGPDERDAEAREDGAPAGDGAAQDG